MNQQKDKFSMNHSSSVDREGGKDDKTVPGVGHQGRQGSVVESLGRDSSTRAEAAPQLGPGPMVPLSWECQAPLPSPPPGEFVAPKLPI